MTISLRGCGSVFVRHILLFAVTVTFLCAGALAAPVISNNTVQTARLTGGTGGTATMATFNHNTPDGTYRFLLVAVSMNVSNNASAKVNGITYNGSTLTFVAGDTNGNNSRRVEFWGLINPPLGDNQVSLVANVQNGRTVGVVVSLTSFNGVDQTTPLGTPVFNDGNGGTGSVNVGSTANDLIVDQIAGSQGISVNPGTGQTQYAPEQSSGGGGTDVSGASSWEAGASPTVNMAETVSGGRWELGGVAVKPTSDLADLVTTVSTFSPDPVQLNATTTATFTITNNGPQAATGATFSITLPGIATNPIVTPSAGFCGGSGPITCTFPTINNGSSVTVDLSVTATTNGTISVTGTADDTIEFDPSANSSATATARAQNPCATPGNDGAGGTLTGVVNAYYPGISTSATSITVSAGNASGANANISAGDLLLIAQMQDASITSTNNANYGSNSGAGAGYTALNGAGQYEFVVATSGVTFGTGGSFTFSGGGPGGTLINTYTNAAAAGANGAKRFQVVRVPQYTSATLSSGLTAAAWNGTSGGILAIDVAGSLALGGTVSVDAKGFRGGGGRVLGGGGTGAATDYVRVATINANGAKGEGIAGTPRYVYNGALLDTAVEGLPNGSMARGAPGNAGGGGTDANQPANDENSGGGGGGNGGAGGRGGNSWNANVADGGNGGVALPVGQSRLFLGGGGGAGTTNNGSSDPSTNTTGLNSSGAIGGGIVVIRAAEITGTGTITANGSSALNVAQDGGGGGGAGGTIMVVTKAGTLSGLTLIAKGGNGGSAWLAQVQGTCPNSVPIGAACNYHGPGGGGGGGVILTSSAPASMNVSGGPNGLTTQALSAFNSTAGSDGATSTSAVFSAVPGMDSGAECASDLTATKSGNGPWIRGNSFAYTLGVTNLGIQDTGGVVTLTDTLPGGMLPTTASGSGWLCSVALQTVACNRSDALSNGQSYPSVTINGTVGQTTPNAVSNTASASGGGEFYAGNDTATYASTTSSVADVYVLSSDSPDPVSAGGSITYTQTAANLGPSDAGNATFSTTIPSNAGFTSLAIPTGWSCTVPPVGSSGTVNCVTNNLAAGTSAMFTMVTTLKAGVTSGVLTNVATISSIAADPSLINNSALTATTVGASAADVTLTNVSSPTALAAGNNITFTQVVRNQGGSAATTVTFSEPIPANTTFQLFSNPGWTCSTPPVGGMGTVSCSIGSLAAGASATFSTVVQVNGATAQGTVITDTVTVGATNDSLTSNNSAAAVSVVTLASQSDLVVSNVASAPQIYAGNNVGFVQTIANNGPATATNVVVNEAIPVGTAFASVTPPVGWSCTAPVAGAFTCSGSSLAVGATATIMLDVTVASSTANNTTITNTVSASSSNGDPNSSNNSASAAATVIAGANLVVTNTLGSGADPVTSGGSYTLSQTIANAGPSDSGTVTLVETVPSSVTVGVITTPVGWSCGARVGNKITCTGPNLAAGAAALNFSIPINVNGGTANGTLLAVSAEAQPAVSEMIPGNNVAVYTNAVSSGSDADLAVTATATLDPVVAGQNLTYTATITNKGPATASTVSFTIPVPANTTFVSIAAPVSCSTPPVGGTGTVTCTTPLAASGLSGVVTLVVKVNTSAADGSTISTTGTISAATSDPNSSNNVATTNTQVIRESDLSITTVDSPDPLNTSVSNVVTYTQVITNNGPSDATNIVVTESVPTGSTFGSVTSKPAGWNCTAPVGGTFTCGGPSLAAGGSGTFIFAVTNGTTGKLTQTATVSSDSLELSATNNTAVATTTIASGTQSDMQAVVSNGSSTVSAGNNVSFTIAVTNLGPAIAANVSVTIPIPPNTSYQTLAFAGAWTCPTPPVGSTGSITCTISSMAANATTNFGLTVQVDGSAAPNTVVGETASVTLAIPANDPDLTNNSSTATSRVTNPTNADLSVTLAATPTSVKTGNSFTLTAVVANSGPASSTNTVFTLPLTSAEQFVSVSSTQGTCDFVGGTVVCNLDTVANAGSATITIISNAVALGTTTNTATVQSNENDPTPANNAIDLDLIFAAPTSVRLVSLTATTDGASVILNWRTKEEVRNLGFNVYRDISGERTRLNTSLIAGSAVRTHMSLAQHSASAYQWVDDAPVPGATYVVEDVSVSGVRTWNGPVSVDRTAAAPIMRASSATVAEISRSAAYHPIPFNPMPIEGTETTSTRVPGWLTDSNNPWRPSRIQSPARVESAWLAGRPAAKIAIDHQGWYRVTQAELNAAGFNTNLDLSALHLYAEGFDVPVRMNSSASAMSFEFYASGLDTPYTGTRIYWLTVATGPGRRIPITTPDNQMPVATSYVATVEKRDRSFYFAALTTNGDQDNFFGDVIAGAPVDQHLTISNIDANGSSTAKLFVELQGITDVAPHDVQVSVNGIGVGNIAFTGMLNRSLTADVPLNLLVEGDNIVTLTPLAGEDDVTAVDRIRITYPRTFTAVQDQLKFVVPGRTTVSLTGFSAPARVFQLDVAALVNTKFTQQPDGTYSGALTNPAATPRTYYAFTDSMVQQAASVTKNDVTNLSSQMNQADLLIVSHRDFIPSLAPLIAARQQQGYVTSVVNIEDVYDQFNYGENSPDALRNLLATATSKWSKSPRWLLLVGDASVDPRNFLGLGSYDFVPTKLIATAQMKTASDGWFADFNETGVPQMAIGRLPVRDAAEANAVVAKLVGYDQQPLGTWNTQALLVTDENIGTDFSGETTKIAGMLPSSLQHSVIDFAEPDSGTIRSELLSQLNAGQLFVNYLGHGSVDVWSGSGILNSADPATLTNGMRLPFVVTMDCLNGFFHDVYQTSLAESFLLAPNGGAAAVWASSGLTEPESQFVMDKNLVQYLFANSSITIGEATTQAKSGVNDVDVRRTWNLFGDPSMKLRNGGN